MRNKSRALALAVAAAGIIGLGAPVAGAATVHDPAGHLADISNNQVPLQFCGNDILGNGAGGQVPVNGAAVVPSLLSPLSVTKGKAVSNRGCVMTNSQQDARSDSGPSAVKITNNQVPVQVCGNNVEINAAGGQVPLYGIAGAFSVLSPAALTKSTAVSDQGCGLTNGQANGPQGSTQGTTHAGHGTCPCKEHHG
jgi:hypothetical protein